MKTVPSAWKQVKTTFVSGVACTPERLRTESERLSKADDPSDFVFIHTSAHGTTENGLLRLDSEVGKVIDADILAASLATLPCPSLVTIDACGASGAVQSQLPPKSAP